MQYKEEKAQLVLDTMQAVRSTSPLLLLGILIVGVAYRCPRYHFFLEAQAQTGSNQALWRIFPPTFVFLVMRFQD